MLSRSYHERSAKSDARLAIAADARRGHYGPRGRNRPIELYNIILRRTIKNPLFIQRSLLYKIHARRQKRIQITLSLSGSTNTELQAHNIFPLYVLLAIPTSNDSLDGHSPIYRFKRFCLLTSFSEFGNRDSGEATFIIPNVKNLSTAHSCNLNIILISFGQIGQTICEDNCSRNLVDGSSLRKLGGKCSWGQIPINLIASYLENCATLSLGHTMEVASTVTMSASFLESNFLEQDSCLIFCSHKVDAWDSYQLQACISAQEAGARAMSLSPYNNSSYNDVPPSSLPNIISLRDGNVVFNYKYYNNMMEKTEVTEDFCCPFCLVRCGSFKILQLFISHVLMSNTIFLHDTRVSELRQTVNVSSKTDVWRTECGAAGVDPWHQTFSYISKLKIRRRLEIATEETKHVNPDIMTSGSPEDVQVAAEDDNIQGENGIVRLSSIDPAHTLCGTSLSQPTVLQFGKTRKLSVNRADPRNRQLLQKRQFFHSHRAQPMASEQLFSDCDSENEVDDDIADFEDKRMLDEFVDVTKDEKLIMHMWNSFVRKQRVLADRHVPWACEAFSRFHGKQLVQNPPLLWSWRFFMIKLWNHDLLDAPTMNTCNIILQGIQDEGSDPKQP